MSLWQSDDPELWQSFKRSYSAAIAAAAGATPAKKNLVELDQWWRNSLAPVIRGRTPPYITRSELSHVMKWKLTRGKMRPLQKLVDSNSDADVQALSLEAFQIVRASRLPGPHLGRLISFTGPQKPRQSGSGAVRSHAHTTHHRHEC